ncbi:MAG: VOC family protein [Chloroflexi bacterium]|nr:VOC family protein [Chloroflexota bacterium]
MPKLELGPLGQVGVVVRDIERVMAHYTETFGLGPWRTTTVDTVSQYRGQPRPLKMKLAFASLGPVQLELIQPLGEEESIYSEFLKAKGEGVQHLGFYFDSLEKAIADFRAAGIGVVQGRWSKEGGFAYMDTEAVGGVCLELLQRRPPAPPASR